MSYENFGHMLHYEKFCAVDFWEYVAGQVPKLTVLKRFFSGKKSILLDRIMRKLVQFSIACFASFVPFTIFEGGSIIYLNFFSRSTPS